MQGDGGQGLSLFSDLDPLLGFDRLMQPVGIAPTFHQTAGEFVDDQDFTVADDIVDVSFHQPAGSDGLIDPVRDFHVL